VSGDPDRKLKYYIRFTLDASRASVILYTNKRMKSPEDRARVICGLMTMTKVEKIGEERRGTALGCGSRAQSLWISNRELPLLEGMLNP
jgi:hypothetical protein